jgi:anti-sigma-K factor RskA
VDNTFLNVDRTPEETQARRSLRPTLVALGCGVVLLVGAGSWFAGSQYDRLNSQQIVSMLVDAQRSETTLRAELTRRDTQLMEMKKTLEAVQGKRTAAQMDGQQHQILRQQAELNDYQTSIERDKRAIAQNELVLNALSEPKAQFLTLVTADQQSDAVAYALILDKHKLLLVASRLLKAPPGREYQLWLTRGDDPKIVSAGTLDPDDSNRAITEFADSELVSLVSDLTVTEEPAGGSKGPTGPKVFVTEQKER